ncbi:Xanthine/uracil/vitamin C permease [Cinara cedri]|uniref:Xanthine/uracil/vitamin C permease n=1 Tax=Cinara cedri TaxID=506608 RepID=A0A5E4N2Q4_9HEMI|nr:Xanthine/uracil/vitamin C permease [Cinara cedri]
MDRIELAENVTPDHLQERVDFLDEIKNMERKKLRKSLVCGVNENPPAFMTVLLTIQNLVMTVTGIILVVNVLAPKLCILPEDPAQAYLLSTSVMMAGIGTLFQTLVGVRIPIVQNSGFVYMTCLQSMFSLPGWQCPSDVDLFSMGTDARTLEWQHRVRSVQGAIIVIGLVQMFLGYSGVIGKAIKYITPLTVVPTMCLIGLLVIQKGVILMSGNWTAAIFTLCLLTIFSQYLRKVAISFPIYSSVKGFILVRFKIFALFSILFSVGFMWIACVYMTFKNHLLPTDPANTDSKYGIFYNAHVFRLPYPFQWGPPIFQMNIILAMLPALLTSIVESVGNYYTCSKFAHLTPPPVSAVNRGIGVQGINLILAGFLGTGSGISASGENVGNIGITRVCSRNVIMCTGCLMILVSPFTKIIALFLTLPDPLLGAVTSVLLVLITAVALSNLQFINLNSIRNMYILGMSIFFGLVVPMYVSSLDENFIKTKYEIVNEVLYVYLCSGMFIGGSIGFILDNTIPVDYDDFYDKNAYYHMHNNDFKSSIEIEDEQIYNISDRLYEMINCILSVFV